VIHTLVVVGGVFSQDWKQRKADEIYRSRSEPFVSDLNKKRDDEPWSRATVGRSRARSRSFSRGDVFSGISVPADIVTGCPRLAS
jgi:hypothetical protein